eukprot:TRINITY_DN6064_c0_g1_i1.p1 TRINITY_DN6064_c0_g1~~TRINITY_DN6064_c0_g1_i1.p1  ORF type:complete len:428 (-),score=91.97 TRINITY_DN6064_c0_g1_i1:161-1444(-)
MELGPIDVAIQKAEESIDSITSSFEQADQTVTESLQKIWIECQKYEENILLRVRSIASKQLKKLNANEQQVILLKTLLNRHSGSKSNHVRHASMRAAPSMINSMRYLNHEQVKLLKPNGIDSIFRLEIPKIIETPFSVEHCKSNWVRENRFLALGDLPTSLVKSKATTPAEVKFRYPYGLAVHPITENVYVVDQEQNRVCVFDANLTFLEAFPSNEPTLCNTGWGIDISPSGLIAIASVGSENVQIFDSAHSLVRIIDKSVSLKLGFQYVQNVAFDQNEDLYITDSTASRIIKVSSDGQYVMDFAISGGSHSLKQAEGITVNEANEVLVLEKGGSCVYVFSTEGDFLRKHEIEQVCGGSPSNMMSRGPCGGFCVSDWSAGMVFIYNDQGDLVLKHQVTHPLGLAFGKYSRLYCANYLGHSVTMYDSK